jgi:AAA family ATP:ADP antiporter
MGIQGGVRNLQWIFTATFVVMLAAVPLFGWATRRFQRAGLVPIVYGFFILNLVGLYVLFSVFESGPWPARIFFIWVSVFNLFVVSIFWSFMADIWDSEQAGRLFGIIAMGGSAGAIVGPFLAAVLSTRVGPVQLMPISIGLLLFALFCVERLLRKPRERRSAGEAVPDDDDTEPDRFDRPIQGGIFSAAVRIVRSPYLAGIALFILLYSMISTVLYFEQAHIVANAFDDPGQRTQVFALVDLVVNVLTVLCQLFLTSRLVLHRGVSFALALVPVLLGFGLLLLGFFPVLPVLLVIQTLRRAGNYAVTRPAREMLFTVVSVEDKYKSKNFIDTVVYRGGDAVSGWAFAALQSIGFGLGAIPFLAAPLAILWAVLGYALGKRKDTITAKTNRARPTALREEPAVG